jgi:SAM-dependent methyltransferase
MEFDPDRRVGYESSKMWRIRCESGFWSHFIRGPHIVDIGYRGGIPDAQTIHSSARGYELGDEGYDGFHLPVPDNWADAVHSSHCLEHIAPAREYIREWYRVLRTGGTMLIFVPHCMLYERRFTVPPSRFSPEHLVAYSPASLLNLIECALRPNTYRIRHLIDQDTEYDYDLPINVHPTGCLEIECVIQKIQPPTWNVEP